MKQFCYLLILVVFASCSGSKEKVVEKIDSVYIKKGNTISKMSFEKISGALKQALADGGIEHALKYCNTHAYALTDSLSLANQASIKRVSNKNRNTRNKADKMEEFLMKGFGIDLSEGNELSPKLVLKNDSVFFYKPIVAQSLCLNCHGEPGKDITFSNDSLIQVLYPRDKAVGYKNNQLRGLWKIGFKKE